MRTPTLREVASYQYSYLLLPTGYNFIDRYRGMDAGRGISLVLMHMIDRNTKYTSFLSHQNMAALLYVYEKIIYGNDRSNGDIDKYPRMVMPGVTSEMALFLALEGIHSDGCPFVFQKIIEQEDSTLDYSLFGRIMCTCLTEVNPNTHYLVNMIRYGSGKCIKGVMEEINKNSKLDYVSKTLKNFAQRPDYSELCAMSVKKIALIL